MTKIKNDLLITKIQGITHKVDRLNDVILLFQRTLEMVDPDLDGPMEVIQEMNAEIALDLEQLTTELNKGEYINE